VNPIKLSGGQIKMELKKGDIVKIYQDPITCKKLEGNAKLLKKHFTKNFWKVKFLSDGFICDRFVSPER